MATLGWRRDAGGGHRVFIGWDQKWGAWHSLAIRRTRAARERREHVWERRRKWRLERGERSAPPVAPAFD